MPWFVQYLIFYLCTINIIAAIVTICDKLAAKRRRRRVRERTLFLLSFLGGGPLMLITMLLIRHKTRHISFMLGIPVIIIVEAALIAVGHIVFCVLK